MVEAAVKRFGTPAAVVLSSVGLILGAVSSPNYCQLHSLVLIIFLMAVVCSAVDIFRSGIRPVRIAIAVIVVALTAGWTVSVLQACGAA